jgi:predicted outer membrane protein
MTMETITRRAAMGAVLLAGGAALAGCQTSKSTASSTGDMSSDDLEFVTNAFNIIEFDRQECTIASTQAQLPQVKALAADFLKEANDFDAQLRPIAAAAGIKPPTILRTDLRVRAARLRLGQGLDFDRSFIDDQIVSHQDALNMQQSMMNTPGGNAQLRELSTKGNVILSKNLQRLRDVQKQLIMMPS